MTMQNTDTSENLLLTVIDLKRHDAYLTSF